MITHRAWFCQHRETIAVGDKRAHWEAYCRASRNCEVETATGCHSIEVTLEFLSSYKGEIAGTIHETSYWIEQ
jgi:hypothetical protein